jgi:hypothetical protein
VVFFGERDREDTPVNFDGCTLDADVDFGRLDKEGSIVMSDIIEFR